MNVRTCKPSIVTSKHGERGLWHETLCISWTYTFLVCNPAKHTAGNFECAQIRIRAADMQGVPPSLLFGNASPRDGRNLQRGRPPVQSEPVASRHDDNPFARRCRECRAEVSQPSNPPLLPPPMIRLVLPIIFQLVLYLLTSLHTLQCTACWRLHSRVLPLVLLHWTPFCDPHCALAFALACALALYTCLWLSLCIVLYSPLPPCFCLCSRFVHLLVLPFSNRTHFL